MFIFTFTIDLKVCILAQNNNTIIFLCGMFWGNQFIIIYSLFIYLHNVPERGPGCRTPWARIRDGPPRTGRGTLWRRRSGCAAPAAAAYGGGVRSQRPTHNKTNFLRDNVFFEEFDL